MTPELTDLIKTLKRELGANNPLLKDLISKLDFKLPQDYFEYLQISNGGEGFIGKNSYLSLWSIENLVPWNSKYEVDAYAPGYFIFGSDGGGTAYAFKKKESEIVAFQFIGMLMDDEPIKMGDDFVSFLNHLYHV
ncbi:MAG TPA: SMI1/KNR4 family protein [Puia sp.]|nr:SMI1/KNR4 family protein [Puia sp.]